jgi:G3E family GTPase
MASVPLHFVTGFLGSGKTTLLARLAGEADGRLGFLVNEFSPRDVDGHLLEARGIEVRLIRGGSLFCRCKAAELREVLLALAAPRQTGQAPWERMVVEASGMADPSGAGSLLREIRLDAFFHPASVITLIDPASFRPLLATLPAVRRQVEAASVVLINKADLFSSQVLDEIEIQVRGLRPEARVYRTSFARIPAREIFQEPFRPAPEEPAHDVAGRDPRFARLEIPLSLTQDLVRLRAFFQTSRQGLWRVKGWVVAQCGGQPEACHLEWDPSGLRIEPWPGLENDPGLTVIYDAQHPEVVLALRENLTEA